MKNSQELIQNKLDSEKIAKSLIDLARKEDRDFSDEENSNFEKLQIEIVEIDKQIKKAKSIESFETSLARELATPVEEPQKVAKNFKNFSLLKFIREAAYGKLTGLEAEMHQHGKLEAAKIGKELNGYGLLPGVFATKDVTVGGSGANLVPTDHTGFIELLRNKLTVAQAGATILPGLTGNIDIPLQNAGATATWIGEQATAPKGDQVYSKVTLSPKRLTAYSVISKQLTIQSVPQAEMLARDDLFNSIAQAIDSAAISGSGVNPIPAGITTFATSQSVAANMTYGDFVNMETQLAADNIRGGNFTYLTTPGVVGKAKQTAIDAGSGIMTIRGTSEGGEVNGYPIIATNQVPINIADHTVILGDFSQLMIGQWGVLDFLVDPYTLATESSYRLIVDGFYDIKSRYDKAFVVVADATIV